MHIQHKGTPLFSTIHGLSYKDSGVDIGAGDRLVDAIKPLAAMTARSGCTAELGGFGGLFDIKAANYKDPLLVSGTDGVGTKLKVMYIQHITIFVQCLSQVCIEIVVVVDIISCHMMLFIKLIMRRETEEQKCCNCMT